MHYCLSWTEWLQYPVNGPYLLGYLREGECDVKVNENDNILQFGTKSYELSLCGSVDATK